MSRYVWLVLIGACSFGILSTFVKLSFREGYSLGEITGVQVFFGMILLWSLFLGGRAVGLVSDRPKEGKEAPWKVIVSGFSTGLVSITYYKCISLVPASIAIIMLMQFVWIGILLEYVLFKKKPSRIQIVSMILVLGGTILAAGLFNERQTELSLSGIFFGLLAAAFYAIFLMVMSRFGNSYPAVQKSALMLTGACFLIFIVFPPTFLVNGVLTAGLWKWGLILASLGTVVPPLFFAIGTPKIGVTLSSIISAIELPVAVAMSYFFLMENVNGLQWLGVFIILGAIIISNIFNKMAYNKKEEPSKLQN